MKRLHTSLLLLILPGLPLAGLWATGQSVAPYLEFPPRTHYVEHAPFSWPMFIGMAAILLAAAVPVIIRMARARHPSAPAARSFPWWGWAGVAFCGLCWLLAWTRLAGFAPLQPYIFTPLWIGYIVVINALTWRRNGRCLLTHETAFLLKLFPLSALFWWIFEYLNRFTQNWWYTLGTEFTPLQYFLAATLPFSTVLPAVLSTEEWLASYPGAVAGMARMPRVRTAQSKPMAWMALVGAGAGLFFLGRFPDLLFPLLWLAPLVLLVAIGVLTDRSPFFPGLQRGDWRRVARFGIAALICGFFWEMWNLHSLAKWIYSIPYVGRFHLFEMPILGYVGYLPFGLECAVVAELFLLRPKQ